MRTLTALIIVCCLALSPLFPTSYAQKQDASERKGEAARQLFRPEEPAAPDLTDAVSRKGGKGKSAAQPDSAADAKPPAAQTAPAGLASSIVASGRAAANGGTAVPHEASGPVYQKVPSLTAERAELMNEEMKEINPAVPIRPGDGKVILDTPADPPTAPVTLGHLPGANMVDTPQRAYREESAAPSGKAAPDVPPQAAAATDLVYGTVRDIPVGASGQRGAVGEPSVGSMGNTIFYTGNWYAARSSDGGATFTYVDPYTTFPGVNRGFCCDQVANYAPAQDMMLWALQYVSDGTSNTLRLARAVGATSVLNNQWSYYNFTAQNFGFPAGAWLDFPDMTVATNFVYLTSNVFNGSRFLGSVVWRVRLSELAAGGAINYNFFPRMVEFDPRVIYPEDLAPRLTEGATTTMYWAAHIDSSRLRIFRWDDASNDILWDDVTHNPFAIMLHDGVAKSPDGTNWAARADSRVLGAWVANGVLGFMWAARQDSNFPYPYTIVARFNQSTRALISQNNIWHAQFAWLMPTASVNASGNVAGLLAYGGGIFYPGTNIWISDDVQNGFSPLALYAAAESNSGPTRDEWGDYHTVHQHKASPNSWVAGTYYLQNGGGDESTVPRYLWFGRERDMGCSFTISPTSNSFSSNGGTGSIAVTASATSCVRTATSNAAWLHVTSGATGTGGGAVNYSVDANTATSSRTGTLTVGGRAFSVTQGGSSCTFSISPTSNNGVPAAGAAGSVNVTTSAGCGWSAASNVGWISITSGANGTGNGSAGYSVQANTGNLSRTGTLTVAGSTFTVTQAAAASGGCTATPIAVGQTLGGTLSNTDCKLTDGSFYDPYTFSGTAGQQVVLKMNSSAFDTFLFLLAPNGSVLASNDDGGGGTNSRIPPDSGVFTLPSSGTYTVLANSFAPATTGGYSLSLTAAQQCTVAGISPNQTLSATLSVTDCNLSDGSYYDSYTFGGAAGQQISVSMSSSAFDTYLIIVGPDGSVVATDDDGGGGTNSRVPPASGTVTLSASGTYTILANSYAAGATGGYSLTLSAAATAAPTVQLGAAGFSVNESARKVLINVTRSGSTAAAASVDYATSDGTASRLRDYTQTLGTLVFAPGEASKTVTVFVTDDAFAEPAETFTFALSDASGATLGAPASAVVTINSDDAVNGSNPVGDAAFNANFFVGQHYIDFLNREADAAGLAFWTGEITQCGANVSCRDVKRINVSAAFFVSIEFQNTGYLVYRFYKAAYGDATSPGVPGTVPVIRLNEFLPDTQRIGQNVVVNQGAWEAQLEANKQAYALEFVQRSRFLAAFPAALTPAQFVDKLRANTGAALTQAERDQLVAELTANNTTAGRASVLRKVAEDAALQLNESNRAFVLMQYFGYLRRNPDDAPEPGLNYAGWRFWLDKLNQFNGNYVQAEMVNAFITSTEYRQRFGP
ncbi:MAG: pre-peptidase C-terminal domain-containing protein [Acidobacteria bacterium]|nr:pre-peptidase C-terminal domain-containing protein [Acidobacteriota bacterium]